MEENTKETKLNEFASTYEAGKILNISDIDRIPTNVSIFRTEKQRDDGKIDQYMAFTHEGNTVRVPWPVISQLKALLEDMKELKFFKVKRTGKGKTDTRYQVIPIMQ